MSLPVVPVVRPSNIAGLQSKDIGVCHLVSVFFPGVGHSSMNPAAARAWSALSIACLAETGVTLTCTSSVDVYRPYSVQLRAFQTRYTSTYDPKVNVITSQRVWNGVRYYLRKGMIPCATPGGGYHPLGLAVDTAIWNPLINDGDKFPGDPVAVRGNAKVWAWLKANVVSLGWSWEYSNEGTDDPHLHYFAGDATPKRVIDVENFIAAHA